MGARRRRARHYRTPIFRSQASNKDWNYGRTLYALADYATDSMFYKWVDVIEPKILGELTNGEWIIYNQTIGIY